MRCSRYHVKVAWSIRKERAKRRVVVPMYSMFSRNVSSGVKRKTSDATAGDDGFGKASGLKASAPAPAETTVAPDDDDDDNDDKADGDENGAAEEPAVTKLDCGEDVGTEVDKVSQVTPSKKVSSKKAQFVWKTSLAHN